MWFWNTLWTPTTSASAVLTVSIWIKTSQLSPSQRSTHRSCWKSGVLSAILRKWKAITFLVRVQWLNLPAFSVSTTRNKWCRVKFARIWSFGWVLENLKFCVLLKTIVFCIYRAFNANRVMQMSTKAAWKSIFNAFKVAQSAVNLGKKKRPQTNFIILFLTLHFLNKN